MMPAEAAARFAALDAFLVRHAGLWRPRPFVLRTLPWEREHAELAAALRGRTLAAANASGDALERAALPSPWPELLATAQELTTLPPLPARALPSAPAALAVDVPGRKWAQIHAFATALDFATPPDHWVDWCAGKGHLGRLLVAGGGRFTALEKDAALVAEGERLSARLASAATHRQCDVLRDAPALPPEATPVALHACGDLHGHLLTHAVSCGSRQLALAPCCYNRTTMTRYRPLSAHARQSALTLDRDDLGLPMEETVTGGARVRRQRDQSRAWRLGFDLLQRELRGVDEYLPTPSLPGSALQLSFADFCRLLADRKQLSLSANVDWPRFEAAGWERLAVVRNLELVRAIFRRPLELWLLLDRVLFLLEAGYRVRYGEFCERRLTPRNLLVLAERG